MVRARNINLSVNEFKEFRNMRNVPGPLSFIVLSFIFLNAPAAEPFHPEQVPVLFVSPALHPGWADRPC